MATNEMLLFALIIDMVVELKTRETTIVNVEALTGQLHRQTTGTPQEQFLAECRHAMRCHIHFDPQDPEWPADRLYHLIGGIKFMSLNEYRESVGPERAALETTMDGQL
jgi:hypothetical protein